MSDKTTTVTSSFPVTGLLGVLFVGLKLTGYITWPWIWVTAPFWIPVAIVLGILLVGGLILLTTYLIDQSK